MDTTHELRPSYLANLAAKRAAIPAQVFTVTWDIVTHTGDVKVRTMDFPNWSDAKDHEEWLTANGHENIKVTGTPYVPNYLVTPLKSATD